MQELKVGMRLKSPIGSAEIMVIRAPDVSVEMTCDGVPMLEEMAQEVGRNDAGGEVEGEVELGKRYSDNTVGIEVLCIRAGRGRLACDGRELILMGPKVLPSAD